MSIAVNDRPVGDGVSTQIEGLERKKQDGEELDPDQEKKILRRHEVIIELEKTQAKLSKYN